MRKHWIGFRSRPLKVIRMGKMNWAGCMKMVSELVWIAIRQSSGIARRPTKGMKLRRKIFNTLAHSSKP